ncbi:MAG TPA: tripartite tricarboxylate transporter TctB family protein [Methylomirabilota bacterium]|nr:tripartite tricarboxylate transporter TctB family protein [Methylomirabilota bacterium]
MIERLLAVGALAAVLVYLASAWALPLGTAARPGAGFYPLAVGVFGAVTVLAWLGLTLRRPGPGAPGAVIVKDARGRVLATAGLLMGFCLALPWTGYPVAALLFTALLLRGLGAGNIAALSIGLLSALASYYGFGTLLGVPLPRGVLLD